MHILQFAKGLVRNAVPLVEFVNTLAFSGGPKDVNWAVFWTLSTFLTLLEWHYFDCVFLSCTFAIVRVYVADSISLPPFVRGQPLPGRMAPREAFRAILANLPQPEDNEDSSPSPE